MWKAIIINLISPTVYLVLWLLPRDRGFIDHHKLFIAEYGQALVIVQLVACLVGCLICKTRTLQIFFILLLILFGFILFNSIEKFNPF